MAGSGPPAPPGRTGGGAVPPAVPRRTALARIHVPRRRRSSTAPPVPLGRRIARRRAVWGGWVAADEAAVVVRRSGRADLRLPHGRVRQIWLEGRSLALVADGGVALYLPLLSLSRAADRRFVRAVLRAGSRTGGRPLRQRPLRRALWWLRDGRGAW